MKKRLNVLFASLVLLVSIMLYFPAKAGPCSAYPDESLNDAKWDMVGEVCICWAYGKQCVFIEPEID